MAINRFQELTLITRCVAADDRNAFGQLVDVYSESLRRFLLGLTKGNASWPTTLRQETFLKAYLSIRSLEGVTRFRTWLFRIAYNEFVNNLRRERKFDTSSDEDCPDIADETPDEPIISAETLSEAITQLSETRESCHSALLLRRFSRVTHFGRDIPAANHGSLPSLQSTQPTCRHT